MENSSKALLIAAAVLMVVLIVTISIKILSPVEGTSEKVEEIGETMSGTSESAIGKLQIILGTSTGTQQPGKEENKIAKVGEVVKVNSTINGQKYGTTNPIIPAGFMPINTETSSWGDGTSAPEVDNGLVVKDKDDNEFVWVPVTTSISAYGIGTTSNREPDVVTYHDNNIEYLEIINNILGTNYKNSDNLKTALETDFNEMATSVSTYGGFYVGRYEMSLTNNKTAQSKKNVESSESSGTDTYRWYGLYARAKTYTNAKGSVKSSMIWGSQYDAMMTWMGDAANTTISGKNDTKKTGSVETDKIKNVYDLYGNLPEITLEANHTNHRVLRGDSVGNASPSFRYDASPTFTDSRIGSRLTLYIV